MSARAVIATYLLDHQGEDVFTLGEGVIAALAEAGLSIFDDAECYQLFIAIDNLARVFCGTNPGVNALREKLLPVYRAWHDEHPNKVHPSALNPAPTGDHRDG